MDPVENLFMALYATKPDKEEISEFERMLEQFSAHEVHEQKFVREYRQIVDRIESPLVTLPFAADPVR